MCLDGKPSTNYVHPSRDLAPTVLRDRTVAPSVRRTGRGASQRCFRRPGDLRQHRHRVRRPRKHGGRRQLEYPATTGAGATASPNLINLLDQTAQSMRPGTWKIFSDFFLSGGKSSPSIGQPAPRERSTFCLQKMQWARPTGASAVLSSFFFERGKILPVHRPVCSGREMHFLPANTMQRAPSSVLTPNEIFTRPPGR